MDHPRPGLRYVDADDLESPSIKFDGLTVESTSGEPLGKVDGFIIDIRSARPYYVVVDAGGWFTSKYFLLPIGHVGMNAANNRLAADLPRERVKRFPGFDRKEFEKLSDAELNRMDEQMVAACCPDETVDASSATLRYERWSHYRSPSWWNASYYDPERADAAARSIASTGSATSGAVRIPSRDDARVAREYVRAQNSDPAVRGESAGDVSPHFGGRAQPGDVLGLETGGEQTHVGETSDDENKRREDAEKSARRDRR